MDETLDRMIKESGGMWADARDRTTSPVLVNIEGGSRGKVYELTLPAGEGHPFWRVNERELSDLERAVFQFFRASAYSVGDLIHMGDCYMRVRSYVFNGREEDVWQISTEKVHVKIERVIS